MTKSYISSKTARLYESPTGQVFYMVLIYGDEIETTGIESSGRAEAVFRTRTGWVRQKDLGTEPVLEAYFIDVGQGDSIYIVTPNRKKILIDGGIGDRAIRFLAWKYRLKDVETPIKIDLLVVTHADEDHIGGLIRVVRHPKIQVKEVIHSGIATFKPGAYDTELGDLITQKGERFLITRHNTLEDVADDMLSETFYAWKKAIQDKGGISYRAVDASTPPIDLGDPKVTLKVAGPRLEKRELDSSPMIRWFDVADKTINGHSVVLRLSCGDVSFLLPGDLNIEGSEYIMRDTSLIGLMDAHVLKAPHHGSHEYSRSWLTAVNPLVSVISSGDEPDHGHPRANFVGAVGQASRSNEPLIFSTELARAYESLGEVDMKKMRKELELSNKELEALDDTTLGKLRTLFKMRLPGMINVRTDGKQIYAMRRVVTGYWWESYGPIEPCRRSDSN